jgi:hypothetical protein
VIAGGTARRGLARSAVASALAFLASGCAGRSQQLGGSIADAGTTRVTGSVAGVSFASSYAVAVPDNSEIGGPPSNQYGRLTLEIASQPLTCSSGALANATFIGLSITVPGTSPVGPGVYGITDSPDTSFENLAALITTDATCTETSPATCTAGAVTIAALSASVVTGSFTLQFSTGESLEGVFTAPVCATAPPALTGASCN